MALAYASVSLTTALLGASILAFPEKVLPVKPQLTHAWPLMQHVQVHVQVLANYSGTSYMSAYRAASSAWCK